MGMQAFHTWISDISIYREYGNNIKEKFHNVLLHHHHHQTHINFLIEIFDATLSKMEAKYMKLVIQGHGNAILSYMDF